MNTQPKNRLPKRSLDNFPNSFPLSSPVTWMIRSRTLIGRGDAQAPRLQIFKLSQLATSPNQHLTPNPPPPSRDDPAWSKSRLSLVLRPEIRPTFLSKKLTIPERIHFLGTRLLKANTVPHHLSNHPNLLPLIIPQSPLCQQPQLPRRQTVISHRLQSISQLSLSLPTVQTVMRIRTPMARAALATRRSQFSMTRITSTSSTH